MIYYLKDILSGTDEDEQQLWKSDIFDLLVTYSTVIHKRYIAQLLYEPKNDCAFYCFDFDFSLENCPSTIIYQKKEYENEIIYYILLVYTSRRFRKLGYATALLNEFVDNIKSDYDGSSNTKPVRIVLSSLESSATFYEEYGFVWTRESIQDYDVLLEFEKFNPEYQYIIMSYNVQ
jgi:GNAT superfamily N-acetyltransferase